MPKSEASSSHEESGAAVSHAQVRVRVDLGYDGTKYSGWAAQPRLRTVQGVVEGALLEILVRARIAGSPRTICAGRTDAGVHARGQVVHLDLPEAIWESGGGNRLVGQLNANLPADVRVFTARQVPRDFDARFSALARTYKYRICDDPAKFDPITRGFVVVTHRTLGISEMNRAAMALVGEHDFSAYCKRRDGASTIRRVLRLDWTRDESRLAVMTIESDAFCHSMVRAITGALVAVGEGREEISWPGQVLSRGLRDSAVTVMRPEGLVLESVSYPVDESVGHQARTARRFRRDE
jgi:tRNA pseudouridine38-40 synthase